jgi:putative mycofactocin binding protein MftB
VDQAKRYTLSKEAAVRPEKFGGLVYRYDNRRLYFLHSKPMADFLIGLDGSAPVGESIETFLAEHKLAPGNKKTFMSALEKLETLEVLSEL